MTRVFIRGDLAPPCKPCRTRRGCTARSANRGRLAWPTSGAGSPVRRCRHPTRKPAGAAACVQCVGHVFARARGEVEVRAPSGCCHGGLRGSDVIARPHVADFEMPPFLVQVQGVRLASRPDRALERSGALLPLALVSTVPGFGLGPPPRPLEAPLVLSDHPEGLTDALRSRCRRYCKSQHGRQPDAGRRESCAHMQGATPPATQPRAAGLHTPMIGEKRCFVTPLEGGRHSLSCVARNSSPGRSSRSRTSSRRNSRMPTRS